MTDRSLFLCYYVVGGDATFLAGEFYSGADKRSYRDEPVDDCDFNLLEGLVIFEGIELTPEQYAEHMEWDNVPHDFDGYFKKVVFRRATAPDLLRLNLIDKNGPDV